MKRFLRSKLVLSLAALVMILAAVIVPLSGSITRSHAASGDTGVSVLVPATAQWVNTGISLNIADQLRITATGSWTPGAGFGTWGPDGSTQLWPDNFLDLQDIGSCAFCATTPTAHYASLIGYIGDNPPPPGSYTSTSILPEAQKVFFVGSNFGVSIARAGTLWLNFNDDAYSNYTFDNAGQVTATVTVTPSSTVSVDPNQGPAGTQVSGSGRNWKAGDQIQVSWADDGSILANTTVQSDSTFTVPFTVPSNATQGAHTVYFTDQTAGYFIPATFTVGIVDLQTLRIVALQSPYVGFSTTFRAFIQNNGSVASGSFNTQWIADGTNFYGRHNNSIPAGAVDTDDHIWSNLTSGRHTLTFIANFDHALPETNYNNNQVTITFTAKPPSYDPGNYAGKSGNVSVGSYNEPNDMQHVNYCGPGASQVLISAWTSNVPDIQTLATEENTKSDSGTLMKNMVGPINNAIGQSYYSIHHASSQADFSNMIARDILDNHHPLITGIVTRYGDNQLIGWDKVTANHIITIYGFDFTSPTVGYIYYYETSGTVAGALAGPGPKSIDYNLFWLLVQQNNIQLS